MIDQRSISEWNDEIDDKGSRSVGWNGRID